VEDIPTDAGEVLGAGSSVVSFCPRFLEMAPPEVPIGDTIAFGLPETTARPLAK
jgi:hypothetical protein